MKWYIIKDANGKIEIQQRIKDITLTRKKRLEEHNKKIIQIIEIDKDFLKFIKERG